MRRGDMIVDSSLFSDCGRGAAPERVLLETTAVMAGRLERVARAMLPGLADCVILSTFDRDGMLRRAAIACTDRRAERRLRLVARLGTLACARALARSRDRKVEVYEPRPAGDDPLATTLFDFGVRSVVVMPLGSGERVLGTIAVGRRGSRLRRSDVRLIESFVRTAVLAIDGALAAHPPVRVDATRDEMVAVVAHELRNLAATVNMAGTLLERVDETDLARREMAVQGILRANEQMQLLVDDLRDLSRMDSSLFTVTPRRTSLRAVVDRAVAAVRPEATLRQLRIETAVPEDIQVACDESRIVQVIVNLTGNALKFTPSGKVVVRAFRASSNARVEIQDEGVGIERADLPHVFDRFWTRAREAGGSGLGLYVAKRIIEAHRGTIGVESDPGRGSTFAFTLPLSGNERTD